MLPAGLRSRITSWIARRYVAQLGRPGSAGGRALRPLLRDGLDPVAAPDRAVRKLPVPFGPAVWLVTGHPEVRAVLGDAQRFSNDFGRLAHLAGLDEDEHPGGLGFTDPPRHTRMRRLLTPEFTARRLHRLQPRIDAIVRDHLDVLDGAERPDLVRDFAVPVPMLVICELLGIPEAQRERFRRLATSRFDLLTGAGSSIAAMSESLHLLRQVIAAQRAEPGDGLLGALIAEHGDAVTDRELAELADGVLTGGYETTASTIALGSLVLLEDAELFELVRADESAVPGAVEELLRYLTAVQVAFPRFARTEVEIGGMRIAAGDVVLCSLSAADRDERFVADPERVRPGRERAAGHLAFGHGAHRCIGAELARMQLRTALPALVRRFPLIRTAVGRDRLQFRKMSIVYGLDSLPVLVGRAAAEEATR